MYSNTEKVGVQAVEKAKAEENDVTSDGEDLDIDDI